METYKNEFAEIMTAIKSKELKKCNVSGNYTTFCENLQFVKLDGLDEKDWPNGIAENSIFVEFELDLHKNTVEVFRCGHIYLTPNDQKKTYLAMCSMKKAHLANGGKWFRRQSFKDADDLAKKIQKFWLSVFETLNTVTNGYPYKAMTKDIY